MLCSNVNVTINCRIDAFAPSEANVSINLKESLRMVAGVTWWSFTWITWQNFTWIVRRSFARSSWWIAWRNFTTTNWKLETYSPTKDWFDLKQLVECRSRTADKLVVLAECKPKPADKLDGLIERESRVADKLLLELLVAAVGCSTKGPDWFVEVTGTFTAWEWTTFDDNPVLRLEQIVKLGTQADMKLLLMRANWIECCALNKLPVVFQWDWTQQ